jgi:hypothetical protein
MIEECRSCLFLCNKADHILQYVLLSNEVESIFFSIPLSDCNFDVADVGVSDPERIVNASTF